MNTQLLRSRSAVLRWMALSTASLVALAAVSVATLSADSAEAASDTGTVVSFTFDDGYADQTNARAILDAQGMKASFFITTGYIGAAGYLTRADLTAIAGAGHEIGGHAVTHPQLAALSTAEATREVCNSRATLTSWGFPQRSFAYPFASYNAGTEQIVEDCGYSSGRGLGDVESPDGCVGCARAETIPPPNPFLTKAPAQYNSTWDLADLQSVVTNAEQSGGGWVQFTFHRVCAGCDSLSIDPALLRSFTAWLAPRAASNNTTVKTVGEVIGGPVKPIVGGPNPPAPAPGVNGITNPSLETAGTGGLPQCWAASTYGNNTPAISTVTPGRTGNSAARIAVSNYVDGGARLVTTLDQGQCSPSVTPGRTYTLSAWYKSTAQTQFDVLLRNSAGVWNYWTSGPFVAASAGFTQTSWQTPAVPAGSTGISFGLALVSNGEVVTDDYALYDGTSAPATLVSGTPTVTGTARVGSVLTATPGNWTPSTATFAYAWLGGGVVIPGATSATYTPVAADVGKTISVRVTGSAAGYTPPSLTVTSAATAAVTTATTSVTASRLAGPDRFATAVAASKEYAPGVGTVYVATGLDYADALSAAPAAARAKAPLLLTAQNALPAVVKTEIQRLRPGKIIVVGGPAAVSAAVLAELQGIAPTTRISGPDRYATSRAIATDAFGAGGAGGAATAYLATGLNFPDALAAAPAAARFAGPVILVPGNAGSVDATTRALLDRLNVATVKIAGGPAVMSTGIESSLRTVPGVTAVQRRAGADRFATAAAINLDAFASSATVYLAVATGFPDALVGSALAGSNNSPIYLTRTPCLDKTAVDGISRLGASKVVLLGGTAVLSDNVMRLQPCA